LNHPLETIAGSVAFAGHPS